MATNTKHGPPWDGQDMDDQQYNTYIEEMRIREYPMLKDSLYLDHAGATLTSKSVLDKFHQDMLSDLYGNPHSFSRVSYRTAEAIERARLKLLHFIKADPEHFDVVFTANATAAMKLVAEAFGGMPDGFDYAYHVEAHTSLIGIRELAGSSYCFDSDEEVGRWLQAAQPLVETMARPCLFAYPAQSNLDARKLPLAWCGQSRAVSRNTFSLLDAAAFAATSPLDLSDPSSAPDFTVLSLYKIFGFPDLGALVIRKDAEHVFAHKKYFGGGTVDMVAAASQNGGHVLKTSTLHERLEDGTPQYHNIMALNAAIDGHFQLFQSLHRVARHTSRLAQKLYHGLQDLRHDNGLHATVIYAQDMADPYSDASLQGPSVAFNLRMASGDWVSNTEFEKLAFARNISVRTGTLCNPGGTAKHLQLTQQDLEENYNMGHRCGSELDVLNGKPAGIIRVSLGAMSTALDIDRFLDFLREFYVEKGLKTEVDSAYSSDVETSKPALHVESLTIYPIKSCAGWQPPSDIAWPIRPEGLDWDREWCIVHAATLKTLSQKRYARMVLIKPELDLNSRVLRVRGTNLRTGRFMSTEIPLDADMETASVLDPSKVKEAEVCGAQCDLQFYSTAAYDEFFTDCLGIPCRLARFPAASATSSSRHAKPHLVNRGVAGLGRAIALSNESPILTITRASLNRLNETIKNRHGKAASPSVFRANIVLANTSSPGTEQPYAEDGWSHMRIGGHEYEFLGACRRCHMVCIDQSTCEKNAEPLATLAKTRRIEGKIVFGVHTALVPLHDRGQAHIKVGDAVQVA